MPNIAEILAEYSFSLHYSHLPDDVAHLAKRMIIDTIGCAIGGYTSEKEYSAWTDNGLIMGLRHKEHPVEGVQFHPESILTPVGKDLLQNFLDRVAER